MSFSIEDVEEKGITEFLLNPFSKAAKSGDFIFQKYPNEDRLDEILAIHKNKNCFYSIGFADYGLKKVFIQEDYPLSFLDIEADPFLTISKARDALKQSVIDVFEMAKVDRIEEIESRIEYNRIYGFNKERLLQKMIFTTLGTDKTEILFQSSLDSKISKFFEGLSVQDVINAFNGHLIKMDKFIEKIIFSDDFILTEVLFKKLEMEAIDYVKTGVFTEREQHLIKYIKHTKTSGANSFTAYFVGGEKVRLKNEITEKGYVTVIGCYEYSVDFEQIEKIEYNERTIYKK